MDIFGLLKVKMAIFLAFLSPSIEVKENNISIQIENKHLITEEMTSLINDGVKIEFEIYFSISSENYFEKTSQFASIQMNPVTDNYIVTKDKHTSIFKNIHTAHDHLRKWNVRFDIHEASDIDFFCQVKLVENTYLKKSLNQNINKLWKGMKPSFQTNLQAIHEK